MSPMRTTRALALTSIVAVTLVSSGCGGAKSRLASHMKRGQDYYQNGDFAKAGVEFRNAMQIDPKDPQARIMAAQTAEKLGQLRNAYGLLQSVVDEHPDNAAARTQLGRLLITAGEPKQGLDTIKPVMAKQPNDATLLALRAAAEAALKDGVAARNDADRAVAIDPRNEDAVDLRAALYKQDGNLPAAIKLERDAAAAQPTVAGFHQILTNLYESANQPELAEGQLRALVKLKPDQLGYRAQLAVFLSRRKRLDDAQQVLADAVKALPHSDEAKLLQVDFLAQERSHVVAEQTLRDYIKADTDNYALRLELGIMLQHFGESAKAIEVFTDIIKSAGTEFSGLIARDRLAAIAVGDKREPEAQRYLAEVLKASPRDNDALAIRGQLALAHGDTTGAIADLRAVLRDQPHSAPINVILAQALIAHGDMALAEEPMRTVLSASPGNGGLRLSLAQLLFRLQHPEQGVAILQEGLKAQPTDKALNEALIRFHLAQHDLAAAAHAAEEYRQAAPNDAAAYLMAGLVAQADNRLDDAQALFEKALSIQPRGYDVLSELVHLQAQRGQEAKAVSRLQVLISADPKDPVIPNLLGEVYLQQKEFKAAQQILGVAIANRPQWWQPYRNMALARIGVDDVPGAIVTYQTALKLAPTEMVLLNDLGALYQRAGRSEDAVKLYETWVRQDAKSEVAANNLAMVLVTYHTDKASLDRAQELTDGFTNADDGDLLDTAGWVQFKRGEINRALPLLQRAAMLMPRSREVRYHLGMAELRSGQIDRARTDLEAAIAGSPRFIGADDARAALASLKRRAT